MLGVLEAVVIMRKGFQRGIRESETRRGVRTYGICHGVWFERGRRNGLVGEVGVIGLRVSGRGVRKSETIVFSQPQASRRFRHQQRGSRPRSHT